MQSKYVILKIHSLMKIPTSNFWKKPFSSNNCRVLVLTVAPTGDHVISLVDEISFVFPPSPPLSQIDDIPPEQFCNGDNRPADCGANCMCTHKVDIPLNAVVEVVLVDEGEFLQPFCPGQQISLFNFL
jgi:hypothetical protein